MPSEVRGARDLVTLWRGLPVAILSYPASELPLGVGLADLSDTLRFQAWREHCVSPTVESCAEIGHPCAMVEGGFCKADALFPVQIGGGAPSWRMATLFLQWRPSLKALWLVALGETACTALGWAARCLREQYRMEQPELLKVARFSDVELTPATTHWQLAFVTPWLVGKNIHASSPNTSAIARELGKSMRARAHKFTALCTQERTWQRLSGHLVHHVANALLSTGLTVEQANIEVMPLTLASHSNDSTFEAISWNGEVVIQVEATLLPWLSLLTVCGGGENADKGFGGVELLPHGDTK